MLSNMNTRFVGLLLPLLVLGSAVPAEPAFKDPLEHPAQSQSLPTQRPLMAIAKAGGRMVAVGSRGLALVSPDGGRSWAQASVPVQSDLTAVYFRNEQEGWAVGHDGVVLHSVDAGLSWSLQLDGRAAYRSFAAHYKHMINAASGDDAMLEAAARQIESNLGAGPTLPFLDVWFEDSRTGFVVGSFGMIAGTTDGGRTWEPWLHRIDNEEALNLNAIRGVGKEVYIAGEAGSVFRLDRAARRFVKVDTGYAGSFFGLIGDGRDLLAFGLRGTAYRSTDAGATWQEVRVPSKSTITGGMGSVGGARFVLVNDAGQLLVSDAEGRDFKIVQPNRKMLLTGIVSANGGSVVLTGLGGTISQRIESEHP